MIPQGALGAAARNSMDQAIHRGSGSGSNGPGCTGGLLCFLALLPIAIWGFACTDGTSLGSGIRWAVMVAVVLGSAIIGFARLGPVGKAAKLVYAVLAGFAVYSLAHADGGGGYIPGILTGFVILLDQISRGNATSS